MMSMNISGIVILKIADIHYFLIDKKIIKKEVVILMQNANLSKKIV